MFFLHDFFTSSTHAQRYSP